MKEKETHESFGTITISHAQGRFDNLFGSNIDTNHAIHLTIQRASRQHELSRDWIHGEKELVSVYLSPLQFAEFLTSMGQGDGTPCTLSSVAGVQMEEPPETEATARKVVREFITETKDIATFAKGADQLVKDILAKGQKMKKGDREELQSIFTKMCRVVSDSAPYLIKQAEEHIDKMVSEAKATITQHANVLGIEAGAAGIPKSLMGGPESEENSFEYLEAAARDAFVPDIPDLPEREIESLSVDDMNAGQVAEKIQTRLRYLEFKQIQGSNGPRFYGANAYAANGKVHPIYVSFQGRSTLTLDQAKEYLKGLNGGSEERHFEFFRKEGV